MGMNKIKADLHAFIESIPNFKDDLHEMIKYLSDTEAVRLKVLLQSLVSRLFQEEEDLILSKIHRDR